MFTGVESSLKYLNLYDVEDSKGIFNNTVLNTLYNLTVCQKDELITEQTAINYCCYFNITTET
jgi:hypothetical protein